MLQLLMRALGRPNTLERLRLASSLDDRTAGDIAEMLRHTATLQDLVSLDSVLGQSQSSMIGAGAAHLKLGPNKA